LQEYRERVRDANVKSALAFTIEDTQEAIARVSSRLRQFDVLTDQTLDEAGEKLLRQSRTRRSVEDKIKFVWQGLKYQVEWYSARIKELKDDLDSQAIFVALAEQAAVCLERWETMMKDMKVTFD
jgi:hypothetical protein